jgi:protein involved in polysaccharide export with SLBB domain
MLKKYLSIAIALLLLAAPRLFAQAAALRVGDSVDHHIAGVPAEDQQQFQNVYTVDENGKINLPYIGLVNAGGMAPSAVQTEIQNALIAAQIYTNPTITVQPSAGARFINVGGAVRAPGRVQYTSDLTLMSTINAAGGFSDFAGDKIRLVRKGKITWYSHKKLDKDPTQDPSIAPGDSVEVPESWW